MNSFKPKEGDIHEVVTVGGHSFTIRYGYYCEEERSTEPIPIYPCFITRPHYTTEGHPLVTRFQDACSHYKAAETTGDGWCADCIHCSGTHREIGICRCEERRLTEPVTAAV